jgi:hypothetical protein
MKGLFLYSGIALSFAWILFVSLGTEYSSLVDYDHVINDNAPIGILSVNLLIGLIGIGLGATGIYTLYQKQCKDLEKTHAVY